MTVTSTDRRHAVSADLQGAEDRVAARIADAGYARLTDAVDRPWLRAAHDLATAVNRPGAQEVLLEGLTAADGDAVDAVLTDRALTDFLEGVATRLHPAADPDDRHVDVSLRVVNGPDQHDGPLWFHYDATVLTVVFPIDIPVAAPGESGELVLYPNRRPFRRFVLTNIVEKMVMQSDVYRRRHSPAQPATVVPLEPGSAYVFSGYRSYHATLPCPVGTRRVTLMVHYKDAHSGSRLLRGSKGLYHRLIGKD